MKLSNVKTLEELGRSNNLRLTKNKMFTLTNTLPNDWEEIPEEERLTFMQNGQEEGQSDRGQRPREADNEERSNVKKRKADEQNTAAARIGSKPNGVSKEKKYWYYDAVSE